MFKLHIIPAFRTMRNGSVALRGLGPRMGADAQSALNCWILLQPTENAQIPSSRGLLVASAARPRATTLPAGGTRCPRTGTRCSGAGFLAERPPESQRHRRAVAAVDAPWAIVSPQARTVAVFCRRYARGHLPPRRPRQGMPR